MVVNKDDVLLKVNGDDVLLMAYKISGFNNS